MRARRSAKKSAVRRSGATRSTTSLGGRRSRKTAEPKAESVPFGSSDDLVEMMCPEDQLQLTEVELNHDFTKTLTSADPTAVTRVSLFDYDKGEFVSKTIRDGVCVLFKVNSILEAKKLESADVMPEDTATGDGTFETTAEHADGDDEDVDASADMKLDDSTLIAASVGTEDEKTDERKPTTVAKPKKVKNEFNFSERASQTLSHATRQRAVMTEPPPTSVFAQQASRHEIYDEYYKSVTAAKRTAEKLKAASGGKVVAKATMKKGEESDELSAAAMMRTLEVMERVVGQNSDSGRYSELKKRTPHSGSVVSVLWTFFHKAKCEGKMVTGLCWNQLHPDMFAAAYGSYDFHKQTNGAVCVYSLKRAGFPQKVISLDSGVTSLDFHTTQPSLLCVGTYDGSVAVFDVSADGALQLTAADALYTRSGDFSEAVWSVQWKATMADALEMEAAEFLAAAGDGTVRVMNLSKNELKSSPLWDLSSGRQLLVCAMDLHSKAPRRVLLGTETGELLQMNAALPKSSATGSSGAELCVREYKGHYMNVYAVRWNPFEDNTFVSCSEDWTLKIWDAEESVAVTSFDLNSAVGDVCWAPFSSTILAAVTRDGCVHVFDLKQDKNQAIHVERVCKSGGLTHVAFASNEPIVVVGDESGRIKCLKLYFKHYDASVAVDGDSERAKLQQILRVTKVLDLDQITSTGS